MSNRVFSCALFALALSVSVSAQVLPQISPLGGGCGEPKPQLNATPPLLTTDLTAFVTGVPAGCPVTIFITPPAPAFAIAPGCTGWIDLNLVSTLAPPYVWTGVADVRGAYSVKFPTTALLGFAPGAPCNVQAVCTMPVGTPGAVDFFGIGGFVSDALTLIMGDVAPIVLTDVPAGTCCTNTRQVWGNCGPAGTLFWNQNSN